MHKFEKLIPNNHHQITDSGIEAIRQQFKFDDQRSDQITAFNPFWFQFWAHQCLDSADGPDGKFNRYNGSDDGQGVYPARMDSPLLKNGYFRTSKDGLPVMHFGDDDDDPDNDGKAEMTVDAHRGNENRILKCMHLMAIKIHNKRMDANDGDFALSKDQTVGTLNQVTLNESLIECQMDECEFFDIKVPGMHQALEWFSALARWAHARMPETVHDEPLFQKGPSKSIDLKQLFLVERARVLNLGVAPTMQKMVHLPSKPHQIIERTSSRHLELQLGSMHDLADVYGFATPKYIPIGCPIWYGILMEAENNGNMLGEIGRRAIADGLAGSLEWGKAKDPETGKPTAKGLWHPRWINAPTKTLDIIEYAEL